MSRYAALPTLTVSDTERFWSYVDPTGFCWLWTGETSAAGYGRIRIQGRKFMAHRVSHEVMVGRIPDGLTVDHLCRVRNCVNPDHFEAVPLAENVSRAWHLRNRGWNPEETAAEQCGNGHWLTPSNTYIRPGRRQRVCRRCKDEQCRRRRARLRAA